MELTGGGSDTDLAADGGFVSTFTSTASTVLAGADAGLAFTGMWMDSLVSDYATGSVVAGGGAVAVGSGVAPALVSSVSRDVELVCAPPVLTTTPGGV